MPGDPFGKRRPLLLLCALLLACAPAKPPQPEPLPTPVRPVLRVGVCPDVPPFAFVRGTALAGIELELAPKLARELDMLLRLVELPCDDLVPALLDRRIDIIMSGLTVTQARALRVAFAEPLTRAGLAPLARRHEIAKYGTLEEIRRAAPRIGVARGSTGEKLVRDELAECTVYAYPSAAEAAADLRGRRIDLVIGDAPTVAWLVAENEAELSGRFKRPLRQEQVAWAVRPESPVLLRSVNEALARWRENGTLDGVLDRWLPAMARSK